MWVAQRISKTERWRYWKLLTVESSPFSMVNLPNLADAVCDPRLLVAFGMVVCTVLAPQHLMKTE